MKIEFLDVKIKKERKKNISYHFKCEPFYFDGDKIAFNSEVNVEGTLTYDESIIIMDVNIKTELVLVCSRCLETFTYPIDIDIEERFTNIKNINNDDVIFVENDSIDLTEVVENAIISTLPIKKVCSESCKGLCPTCGINLNKETCSCNNEDIDLRLMDLKALLSNKEV